MDIPAHSRSGSLTTEQLSFYNREGYLVLPGLLNEADLAPARAAMEQKVAMIADELLCDGLICDRNAHLDSLLKDTAKLKGILLYPVVKGKVMAADVVKLKTADTVQGKLVTIKVDGSKVFINDALVIITDIQTSNGVIHVLDMVILPPALAFHNDLLTGS